MRFYLKAYRSNKWYCIRWFDRIFFIGDKEPLTIEQCIKVIQSLRNSDKFVLKRAKKG